MSKLKDGIGDEIFRLILIVDLWNELFICCAKSTLTLIYRIRLHTEIFAQICHKDKCFAFESQQPVNILS